MTVRVDLLVLMASIVEDVNSRTGHTAGELVHTISGIKSTGDPYWTL